ncbi:unnamed protein product [Brachionus calyciflorus]|uniref:RNA ligase domain-containing protein n=1 Tax=Brachionus calyciflorus TaxID=104777 RepID=A0A813Z239_9BILA|nr:unnamed protein product [Brachionus calyciflorus]
MSFLTYESIPNSFNKKEIEYFFKKHPEYWTKKFICEHKYDGSNFQIILSKVLNEETKTNELVISYASRNCVLTEDQDFNNFRTILKEDIHVKALENVKKYFLESDLKCLNLFGEIYGKVQKRIKYDLDNRNKLVFFDVVFDEMYQNSKFFFEWAKKMELPVVEYFMIGSFEECMAFDVKSVKTQAGDSIEGIVVKPYDDELTKPFYVKVKMEGFEEIVVKPKEKEDKTQIDKNAKFKAIFDNHPEMNEFENYLNSNRAVSAFSKKAWVKKELPQLAHEILTDALKDFKIDHEESKITIDMIKKVYLSNVFKIITDEKFFD